MKILRFFPPFPQHVHFVFSLSKPDELPNIPFVAMEKLYNEHLLDWDLPKELAKLSFERKIGADYFGVLPRQ